MRWLRRAIAVPAVARKNMLEFPIHTEANMNNVITFLHGNLVTLATSWSDNVYIFSFCSRYGIRSTVVIKVMSVIDRRRFSEPPCGRRVSELWY